MIYLQLIFFVFNKHKCIYTIYFKLIASIFKITKLFTQNGSIKRILMILYYYNCFNFIFTETENDITFAINKDFKFISTCKNPSNKNNIMFLK